MSGSMNGRMNGRMNDQTNDQMNGPFRDETAGLVARIAHAHDELGELQAAKRIAIARYEAARTMLEGKFASGAFLPPSYPGGRWSARAFWTGALWGALLGLLMWPPLLH